MPSTPDDLICPLCGRPIPDGAGSLHHLVPKSEGGRETVLLHRICHNKIHALIPERELARCYSTIEALKAHPGIARFLAWVSRRPPAFHARTEMSRTRRRR